MGNSSPKVVDGGLRIERTVYESVEPHPAVAYVVENDLSVPVAVEIADSLPGDVPPADVGFRTSDADEWTVSPDGEITYATTIDDGGTARTAIFVRHEPFPVDAIEATTPELTAVEAFPGDERVGDPGTEPGKVPDESSPTVDASTTDGPSEGVGGDGRPDPAGDDGRPDSAGGDGRPDSAGDDGRPERAAAADRGSSETLRDDSQGAPAQSDQGLDGFPIEESGGSETDPEIADTAPADTTEEVHPERPSGDTDGGASPGSEPEHDADDGPSRDDAPAPVSSSAEPTADGRREDPDHVIDGHRDGRTVVFDIDAEDVTVNHGSSTGGSGIDAGEGVTTAVRILRRLEDIRDAFAEVELQARMADRPIIHGAGGEDPGTAFAEEARRQAERGRRAAAEIATYVDADPGAQGTHTSDAARRWPDAGSLESEATADDGTELPAESGGSSAGPGAVSRAGSRTLAVDPGPPLGTTVTETDRGIHIDTTNGDRTRGQQPPEGDVERSREPVAPFEGSSSGTVTVREITMDHDEYTLEELVALGSKIVPNLD